MARRWLVVGVCIALAVSGATVPATPGHAQSSEPPPPRRTIEVLPGDGVDADTVARQVAAAGGAVSVASPGAVIADVPLSNVNTIDAGLDGQVRTPLTVDIRPQAFRPSRVADTPTAFGPTTGGAEDIIRATAWHDAGHTGQGVTIGVIDFFDTAYWDVDEHGPLPRAGETAFCFVLGQTCTSEFFDGRDRGGEDHGVAVVEVIRDVAPDAEIIIGQAATIADYYALIDAFARAGVDIINRSLGSRYDGPGDGSGPLNAVVDRAAELGMLWVNSAGNSGEGRYYRHPVSLIADRVNIGRSGSARLRANGCLALAGVRWANDWNVPARERTDYDVLIWEAPIGSGAQGRLVDSSVARQRSGAPPLEVNFAPVCPSSSSRALYIEVRLIAGTPAGDVLEILDYGDGFAAHTSRAHSAAIPAVDSAAMSAISVAAVDPPTGGRAAPYSSAGPTNDGRPGIDIAAPAGFASATFGEPFSGTSAAAPVVAAAAALLDSAGLAVGPPHTLASLLVQAVPQPGRERSTQVGSGRLQLPAPPTAMPAATPSRYVPLAAAERSLDTRPATRVGSTTGPTWPGQTVPLGLDGPAVTPVPDGATAALVNLVTVRPDRPSYLQVLRPFVDAYGEYSNLNADTAGQLRTNLVVVPLAPGTVPSVTTLAEGHLVADVLGYFVATDESVAAGRFVDLATPRRLVDTREGGRPIGRGDLLTVDLPAGLRDAPISAAVVSIVAVAPTNNGWLQAIPGRQRNLIGTTSTVNVTTGSTAANLAVVPVRNGQFSVAGSFQGGGSADVVVDMVGYVTSAAAPAATAGLFVAQPPERVYDSRATPGRRLRTGEVITVDADLDADASNVGAVFWNATVVRSQRLGYVTAWAADTDRPNTSSMNWSAGETRAAAVVTAVADSKARFVTGGGPPRPSSGHAFLVLDVFGYFLG